MRKTVFAILFSLSFTAAPATAQDIARIEVAPAAVEAQVGDTVRLQATAYDADGNVVESAVTWFTSYEIGQIDSTGTFVAAREGENRIVAAAPGNVTAAVEVRVGPLPASEIEIRVPATTVTAGSWLPLDAVAKNRLGRIVFDARPEWTSSDPAVAEPIGDHLEAKAPGTVTLSARVGDTRAERTITVEPAPEGGLAIAEPSGAIRTGDVHDLDPRMDGRPIPAGTFPRYSVTGPSGATVYPDGAFVAEEPGRYVVAAGGFGPVARAVIDVEPRTHDRKLSHVGRGAISYAHTGDLWVFDDVAYLGNFGDQAMRVFDVSDPANPVMTDSLVVNARRVNDVKVNPEGGYAVITREGASDRKNGIVILDVADPKHPTILSEYTETVTGGVHNTFLVGDLIYLVNDGTRDMHIVDVSDRENPREVGRWGLENESRVLHDVFVKDGIAYLSYWDDGLVILDLGGAGKGGTPTEPAFVSRVYYPEGNTHVAWRWRDYVFVGDEIFPAGWDPTVPFAPTGYIHVYDVSDLENPVEVATYEVPEAGAHNLWIEDDEETLYIGYYNAGLRALDVSGELRGDLYDQGREIDHYLTRDDENVKVINAPMNWGAMIHDGKIYSADMNSGLWIHEWVPAGDEPIS